MEVEYRFLPAVSFITFVTGWHSIIWIWSISQWYSFVFWLYYFQIITLYFRIWIPIIWTSGCTKPIMTCIIFFSISETAVFSNTYNSSSNSLSRNHDDHKPQKCDREYMTMRIDTLSQSQPTSLFFSL